MTLICLLLPRVPCIDTEFRTAEFRKAQADSNRSMDMEYEVKALRQLTKNASQHTPQLINILHTTQGDDGMVPTGFISFILMTWCPGIPLGAGDYARKSKDEQDKILEAFKDALA
jgi:hypothetical protein